MSTGVLETCWELEWMYTKKRIVRQVGFFYENWTEMRGQQNIKLNSTRVSDVFGSGLDCSTYFY
jgi:hypothetical protein